MTKTRKRLKRKERRGLFYPSHEWWNEKGKFRLLHKINTVRISYISSLLASISGGGSRDLSSPLKGLHILDAGCGGGLAPEAMASLGAEVTGIDISEEAISAARKHAADAKLSINYRLGKAEDMAGSVPKFDIITAFEVLEHAENVEKFLGTLFNLLKPRGLLIVSTINRTPLSFLCGVLAAEYILGWVPRGTHDWNKFIRPSELVAMLEAKGFIPVDITGMFFNPFSGEFELKKGLLKINYLLAARKL